MSNEKTVTKPVAKKVVTIKESDLVDLIDNIVTEAVAEKKKEWLSEQATKQAEKNSLLENRLLALETTIKKLTVVKK